MRGNITWDAAFTLVAEGFSHAQLQWRNNSVHREPMFFAYQMAQTFYGYDLLASNYSSAMASLTDVSGNLIQYPWAVVRVFRDPATQRIHLFVVNQHASAASTVTGFENWTVVEWKQIRGDSYAAGNPLDQAPPEPIQTRDVALPPRGQALAIPPISINHIVLAAGPAPPTNVRIIK
jgi:alpha-L-arabinofuranosidase